MSIPHAALRLATRGDLASLDMLGRAFHAASPLASVAEWNPESFQRTCAGLIGPLDGVLLVAEHDDALVGMIGAMLFPLYTNAQVGVAQSIFWYAAGGAPSGTGRVLLSALESVVRELGARVLIGSGLAGERDAAVARVYAGAGFRALENSFMKELV